MNTQAADASPNAPVIAPISGVARPRKWGRAEWLFLVWVVTSLVVLYPVTLLLQGSFPIFTVAWLIVPLVAVLLSRDASRVGFRPIPPGEYLRVTAINLGCLLLVAAAIEPWSHTYEALVKGAISAGQLDTTFAWVVRYQGPLAWGGMLLYSGLVTIFGEELFFRGWLLQLLQRRVGPAWAVALQATFFTLPQAIAALLLSPLQGVLLVAVYSWLGIGMVGGWAAARTQSIWPSLTSAVLFNFILTLLVL